MEHNEMVALIRDETRPPGGIWADLGAGTGNFTWALAELLSPTATIHAIDRDGKAIAALRARQLLSQPAARVLPMQADVRQPLHLPLLDGILMANLLHFLSDQAHILQRFIAHLRPGGRLLVVEYEQSQPISFVPFPVPFARLSELSTEVGLINLRMIGSRTSPSSGRILYAASAVRPK